MPVQTRLRLVAFPHNDAAFREDVERALERLSEEVPDEERRDRVLNDLRRLYRAVQIVAQNELAQHDSLAVRTWYVYRDGRIRRPDPDRERLYAALATARRTYDASQTAMADARAAARIAGYDEPVVTLAVGAAGPIEASGNQSTRRTDTSV